MATYINGITDYVPRFQPFKPDLNFYNAVLQTKEAQYQEGYQKISNLVGTLLKSELTRDSDITRRDEFFKQIRQEIQKMSMVDLSMPQNVNAARQVFQPLINDKNIVSDMSYTKQYRRELAKADQLRNCIGIDKKNCQGYWEPGVQNLEYWRQDYKRTTDEEALKYNWTPRYVPAVDIQDKFGKLLKDTKVKLTSTSFSKDNRFIVEQTNGTQLSIPLADYMTSTIGSDPGVVDMYNVLAQNQRHQWINSRAQEFGGDYGAAEDAYNRLIENAAKTLNDDKDNLERGNNLLNAKISTVKSKIDSMPNGVSTESPLYKALAVLLEEKQAAEAATSQVNDAIGDIQRAGVFTEDRMAKRYNLDRVMGYSLMRNNMINMADGYAKITSETKIKSNPYQLAYEKHAMSMAEIAERDRLASIRDANKAKAKMQQAIAEGKVAGPIANTYRPNMSSETVKGASTGEGDELYHEFRQQYRYFQTENSYKAKAVKEFYSDLANAADGTDPDKRDYAVAQIEKIFGPGKGRDGTYSTREINTPENYYKPVSGLVNDPVFNSQFSSTTKKIGDEMQNVNLNRAAINAFQKQTRDNISNLFNYLTTSKKASDNDIAYMRAVIDERSGNERKAEDIQKRLKDIGVTVSLDKAEDIKKEYGELFRGHYSEPYTMGTGSRQTSVVRPYDWIPGQAVVVGGVAATPISSRIGVSKTDMNQGTVDALAMYRFLESNASYDNYTIYKGAGVTSEQKGEGIKPEEGSTEYQFLQYALSNLSGNIKVKPSKDSKLEGMGITLHPIIMNDENLKGVTFSIPEALFNKWKKEGKAQGQYSDYSNLTIVMPKEKAPIELFGRFNPQPVRSILRNGGVVEISYPNSGKVKLIGNNDGTYSTSGEVKYIGPDGKTTKIQNANMIDISSDVSPDEIYNRINLEMNNLNQKNFELIMSPYNPINQGIFKSGDEAEQYYRSLQTQLGAE